MNEFQDEPFLQELYDATDRLEALVQIVMLDRARTSQARYEVALRNAAETMDAARASIGEALAALEGRRGLVS